MVMPPKDEQSASAAGPGTEGGQRPTVVPGPAAANPELSERPRRRSFTVQDKLRILEETDRAVGTGEVGSILRREGLYSSALTDWRRQRAAGILGGLTPGKRGPKTVSPSPLEAELAKVQEENARLRLRLGRAEAIIDLQKNNRRPAARLWPEKRSHRKFGCGGERPVTFWWRMTP